MRVVIAGLITVALSVECLAQPVQWRVEDGGNGHWYEVTNERADWQVTQDAAVARGWHLVTITSAAENAWLTSTFSAPAAESFWIGYTDAGSEGSWRWVTGEPSVFDAWAAGEPNNYPSSPEGEDFAHLNRHGTWFDYSSLSMRAILEMAVPCPADLNADHLLDFFDVSLFLGFFLLHDPAADFNGDGVWDFWDVGAFLEAYFAGCP